MNALWRRESRAEALYTEVRAEYYYVRLPASNRPQTAS